MKLFLSNVESNLSLKFNTSSAGNLGGHNQLRRYFPYTAEFLYGNENSAPVYAFVCFSATFSSTVTTLYLDFKNLKICKKWVSFLKNIFILC